MAREANRRAPSDGATLVRQVRQGSIRGSVLSKSDPTEPELTPANTGNLTQPDPPLANS
jgi:hypothetical protein